MTRYDGKDRRPWAVDLGNRTQRRCYRRHALKIAVEIGEKITFLSNRPPPFFVFECDGTLVDSARSMVKATARAWEMEGLSRLEPVSVRSVVCLHPGEAIQRLRPGGSIAVHNYMVEYYKNFFLQISNHAEAC